MGFLTFSKTKNTQKSWRHTIMLTAILIVFPMSVYFFIANRLGFVGPNINLDLLAIFVLTVVTAIWNKKLAIVLALVGLTFTLSVQMLLGVGAIYLDDPSLIVEYLGFFRFWPWRLIGFWSSIAFVCLGAIYFLMKNIKIQSVYMWPVIASIVLIAGLDLAARTGSVFSLVGSNVATSGIVRFVKLTDKLVNSKGFSSKDFGSDTLVDDVLQEPPERVLSISVEALGLLKQSSANASIFAPLTEILGDKYEIIVGEHRYKGATLSGEMRELCGLETTGTPNSEDLASFRENCLPFQLRQLGYSTLGIHGNSKYFYNRAELYREVGFEKSLFLNNFPKTETSSNICKTRAFEGICDRDAIAEALKFVSAAPRLFAHVMTLDTHFPLSANASVNESCENNAGLSNSDLCLYANQMRHLLQTLAHEVKLSANMPDAIFVYGDHGPPYAVANNRNAFVSDSVPYIILKKRDLNTET